MSGYLTDTSIFIAAERGELKSAQRPPAGEARISIATLTELEVGVRRASGPELRRLRETTFEKARSFIALPYDEPVSSRLSELVAMVRSAGLKPRAMDAIIAATALAHDLAVWTLDDDFRLLAELQPKLEVIL